MKTSQGKEKVAAKVAKGKAKVEKKCGGAKKTCAIVVVAFLATTILCGCSTAEAPTAQRAQTVTVTDNVFNFSIGQCEPCVTNHTAVVPSFHFEFGTAAQANETSGTETMTATNTQTPTNDVKTDLKFTYGLASDTAAGTNWLQSLTDASLNGLSTYLKSGKATGTMTVTKKDGSTETVTCKDGSCTRSNGDCITCSEPGCADCQVNAPAAK